MLRVGRGSVDPIRLHRWRGPDCGGPRERRRAAPFERSWIAPAGATPDRPARVGYAGPESSAPRFGSPMYALALTTRHRHAIVPARSGPIWTQGASGAGPGLELATGMGMAITSSARILEHHRTPHVERHSSRSRVPAASAAHVPRRAARSLTFSSAAASPCSVSCRPRAIVSSPAGASLRDHRTGADRRVLADRAPARPATCWSR